MSAFSVAERGISWDVSEWYLAVSEGHTLDGEDVPKELEIRTYQRPQGEQGELEPEGGWLWLAE